MFGWVRLGTVILSAVVLASSARADFFDQPFALRLFFAVDRQSNYASTLARQASIAALEGGSANPGAAAWRQPSAPATTVTTSFVYAPSTGGRDVYAAPFSLRWQAPGQGTLLVAYAYTDTNNARGDNGLAQLLRSDEWFGGYGRRIDEHSAAGITVRLTSGRIVSDSISESLAGAPVRATTSFLTPDINAGYVAELSPTITMGLVAGYGRAVADTTITSLAPLVVQLPGTGMPITIPPGTLLAQPDDVVSTYSLRGGLGFHLNDRTDVYLDAIGLRMSTHNAGANNLGRFALGAQHFIGNGWFLNGGIGVDTLGKVNLSAGLAYRPVPSIEAQIAFQSNAAPEVKPEIGTTPLVAGSLAWVF
jgi:hypothetical protein